MTAFNASTEFNTTTVNVCVVLPKNSSMLDQWSSALDHFVPDSLYVIGGTDEMPRSKIFKDSKTIETAEGLPDLPLVLLAPDNGEYVQGEVSLTDFSHPEECTYMFGSDRIPLSEDQLGTRKPDYSVYIPTDTPHDMYSFTTYCVTMWDRRMKHG